MALDSLDDARAKDGSPRAQAERVIGSILGDPDGHKTREITDKARELAGLAQEKAQKAKDGALDSVGKVDAFTRQRPFTALAIASVAGLVLGHIMSAHRPTVVVVRAPPQRF